MLVDGPPAVGFAGKRALYLYDNAGAPADAVAKRALFLYENAGYEIVAPVLRALYLYENAIEPRPEPLPPPPIVITPADIAVAGPVRHGSGWRYLFYDLRANYFIAELPIDVTQMEMRLPPGIGGFQATLNLADERIAALPWRDACEPRRSVIYAERDGTLMQTGWTVWDHSYDPDKRVLSLTGAELWSYFHRRFLSEAYSFTNTDQFDIARALMLAEAAQESGAGSISVDIDPVGALPLTGRLRERNYDKRKDLASAIEELSNVIDGFDFTIFCYRDELDHIRRRFLMQYPRLGSTGNALVFTYPGNIQSFNWSVSGSASADRVTATSDEGLEATAVDTDQLAAGYALLEQISQYSGITDPATLLGHAQADLAMAKRPVPIPTVKVRSDMFPKLGSYFLGDDAILQMADEIYFGPGYELNERWRIIGIDPDPVGNLDALILNNSDGVRARVEATA